MRPHLRTSPVAIPPYVQSLIADLCEHSHFDLLHTSRQLDGIDDVNLIRKFEMLHLNAQSDFAIDSVRIVLRNRDGVVLTITWGVFEEDLPSADADTSAKSCFAQLICLPGASDITPVFAALSAAGFEALSTDPVQDFSVRFIRGQAMGGKMRLGIHVNLDYGPVVAGRGYAMRGPYRRSITTV